MLIFCAKKLNNIHGVKGRTGSVSGDEEKQGNFTKSEKSFWARIARMGDGFLNCPPFFYLNYSGEEIICWFIMKPLI